jgi:predicted HTH transcriptional regulator
MRYPESESSTVEWKQNIPQNDQLIKTAIGFCNQFGGRLVIGVDNEGEITGIAEKTIEQLLDYVDKAIYEATSPSIIPRISIQRFEDKAIMVIEIAPGMNKPYYRTSEGIEKGTYIRLGRSTLRATKEIIEELQWQSRGIDHECLPLRKATLDDLDKVKIKKFLDNRKNKNKMELTNHLLKAYDLIVDEQTGCFPTVAGILLFGHTPQRYLSEAMIICSHFLGTSGRDTLATVDCEGTLFEQFNQAYGFILSRLYSSFTIRGPRREEILEVPESAIREALLNTLVHRNYHIKAPIKIAIYDDRIEFFSPGQFPGPMKVDHIKMGITYLRNPAICKIFREAGYIEKLGTGLLIIFTSYAERGLKSPEFVDGENYVKCVLPRKLEGPSGELARVMKLFEKTEEISIQDVMNFLSVSRASAGRRLKELVDKGCIARSGHTKAVRYKKKE